MFATGFEVRDVGMRSSNALCGSEGRYEGTAFYIKAGRAAGVLKFL